MILQAVSDLIDNQAAIAQKSPSYCYEGHCPQTGELLRLPRTALVEAIAHGLIAQLAADASYCREGKMYGVLLVQLSDGSQGVLKAFSGLLCGRSVVEGWVPPIPGRDEVALEEVRTLAQLDAIKRSLLVHSPLAQRQQYETIALEFQSRLASLHDRHRHSKQQRQQKRQLLCQTLTGETLTLALEQLKRESQLEGIELRRLKRQRDEALQPLQDAIASCEAQTSALKQRRKQLSRQLQAQMHAAYTLTNFAGNSRSLDQIMPQGTMPTGTGDCCAPKLLHYAATQDLKPLAMAEFWWGASASGDKIPGQFYGACAERCQPLMGFLLSGLSQTNPNPDNPATITPNNAARQNQPATVAVTLKGAATQTKPAKAGFVCAASGFSLTADPESEPKPEPTLAIVYEDQWLIAIDKPSGLLSVPGRYRHTQDSVVSRLRHLLPDGMSLNAVHRLDLETSGILLLARDPQTYRQLSLQFQQRQIRKVYQALLSGIVACDRGMIELPLWGNPQNRPYQQVDWQYGKPSVTHFQVMATEGNYTRIEFIPITGRTHQLRVHAADTRGLGVPILGDSLYGCDAIATRLHLHARELSFEHPQLRETLHLLRETPF